MVAEADLNGDGYIDFSEFSSLMKNKFGLSGDNNISQHFWSDLICVGAPKLLLR